MGNACCSGKGNKKTGIGVIDDFCKCGGPRPKSGKRHGSGHSHKRKGSGHSRKGSGKGRRRRGSHSS